MHDNIIYHTYLSEFNVFRINTIDKYFVIIFSKTIHLCPFYAFLKRENVKSFCDWQVIM